MPVTLENGARIRIADNAITFTEEEPETTDEHLETVAATIDHAHFAARAVALLVCDIRAFSMMSEKTRSGDLAHILGAWFRETGNVVARSGGTIDKFMGDAMLAYWSVGQNGPEDCGAAFAAGCKMLELASERTWPNGERFRIAVALHYGRVTCSNVGVAAERDATIVGDAVNTVFRLEAVSKELNQPLVLSGIARCTCRTRSGSTISANAR
jgi:adenylate cyclase